MPLLVAEHFANLADPRVERAQRHTLLDILVIALCAVICGADTFVDIARFGKAKEGWLQERLGLELRHGIPSHDTFGRIFARLGPETFGQCFRAWTQALHTQTAGQIIALDGKMLRHSFNAASGKAAIHMVSAWAGASGLVLGQVKVEDKSNEITALPLLLKMLDLSGSVVTVDAMGCQKAIAAQVREQGGDYVLALKDNHPRLHDEVRRLFAWGEAEGGADLACDFFESRTYDHGRQEVRRCFVTEQVHWLDETDEPQEWAGLRSVARVESQRTAAGKTTTECRYFLSSLPADARRTLGAVREHWGIENGLHWVLDMAFGEDGSRVRKDHAPQNLATLRHLALNLLRQEKADKNGVKARRLRAGWDNDYLLQVLAAGTQRLNAIALQINQSQNGNPVRPRGSESDIGRQSPFSGWWLTSPCSAVHRVTISDGRYGKESRASGQRPLTGRAAYCSGPSHTVSAPTVLSHPNFCPTNRGATMGHAAASATPASAIKNSQFIFRPRTQIGSIMAQIRRQETAAELTKRTLRDTQRQLRSGSRTEGRAVDAIGRCRHCPRGKPPQGTQPLGCRHTRRCMA